ncbi:MAG: endonuclease/exonuclease/phosphatase family protein [Myxococcales bacterium]|nr:endonuclease/exonuclease/phosphatase family protein [Myxococcales bacterium]
MRTTKLMISKVLLGVGFLMALACAKPSRIPTQPGTAATLKVMSFNVNFGLDGDADSLAAIRNADSDIVLLQETTAVWEQHIRRHLGDIYPHMAFRQCCGAGGLAILSKGRLLEDEYLQASAKGGWFPAWRHVVETPVGRVQALNVHLRPAISRGGSVFRGYFSTPSVRRKEIDAFVASLDDTLPTIVAGDFNEDSDGDAVQFLRKKGLRSALPEFRPGADTWRWQTSVGTIHSQLDHIAYDPRLMPLDAVVVKRGHSDHWPIVATFVRAK